MSSIQPELKTIFSLVGEASPLAPAGASRAPQATTSAIATSPTAILRNVDPEENLMTPPQTRLT